MTNFNKDKLHTTFMPSTTECTPVKHRKYTLTHSDTTGQLFLSIGNQYNLPAINFKTRDEVLAEWIQHKEELHLWGKVYVSRGEFDVQTSKKRFLIFQRELTLALTAIFYGDRKLFNCYPRLLDSPIYIQFDSIYPKYNQMLYYGTPRPYLDSIFFSDVTK
ncbi:staygreen family protein [Bacillus sp. FJAT-49736]|uniref:staygreen family protein n=1 Tax=Bacillus sp. FJAT-49736 TaxID=2833582 RepID=UPI001BC9AA4F|nr:staygreen family protein [Bacillus sp. FJAT-49736]MBS4172980.1 staygreen family protein [Bacillus sp. FJAT-49736]